VWKFPDSGEVLFRISSFSRAAGGGNPLVRIGFRLIGRRQQLRFLTLTAERMARLTEERTAPRRAASTGGCLRSDGSDAPLDTRGRYRDPRHHTG
jgi:hypothetical protein